MSHVVLLGDSIFDNAAYVRGGPAVIDQVAGLLPEGWRATLKAVDGSVIDDVHRQLERLPGDASHLILSAGGNDILGELGVLGARVSTVGEGLRRLADIRERFDRDYDRLIRAIRGRGLPSAVCTIYNPWFPDPVLQREAVAALCLFDDGIIRAAQRSRLPILDLRAFAPRKRTSRPRSSPRRSAGTRSPTRSSTSSCITTSLAGNPSCGAALRGRRGKLPPGLEVRRLSGSGFGWDRSARREILAGTSGRLGHANC